MAANTTTLFVSLMGTLIKSDPAHHRWCFGCRDFTKQTVADIVINLLRFPQSALTVIPVVSFHVACVQTKSRKLYVDSDLSELRAAVGTRVGRA